MLWIAISGWTLVLLLLVKLEIAASNIGFLEKESARTRAMLQDARMSRQYASRLQ
jgi:hypothetical protein